MRRIPVLVLAFAFALAACGGGTPTPDVAGDDTTPPPADSTGDTSRELLGAWELRSGTSAGTAIDPPETHRITLVVDSLDAVGGTSACNQYFGELTVAGGTFTVTGGGATEMACEPIEVMDTEQAYLEALQRVETYALDGDELTLTGSQDTTLVFERQPPPPTADLMGTTWVLDTLTMGETATNVRGEATARFHADGTFEGSTGCRTLTGEWQESGDEIVFTSFSADGECSDQLWDQDNHVVSVLGDGFRAEIDAQHLTVTSRDGDGLRYTASSDS